MQNEEVATHATPKPGVSEVPAPFEAARRLWLSGNQAESATPGKRPGLKQSP